jgi:transposase
MTDEDLGVAPEYQISDELWERIEPLLPSPKPKKKSGRPRMDDQFEIGPFLWYHHFMIISLRQKRKTHPQIVRAPSEASSLDTLCKSLLDFLRLAFLIWKKALLTKSTPRTACWQVADEVTAGVSLR